MNGLLICVLINLSIMVSGIFFTNFLIIANLPKDFPIPSIVIMVIIPKA